MESFVGIFCAIVLLYFAGSEFANTYNESVHESLRNAPKIKPPPPPPDPITDPILLEFFSHHAPKIYDQEDKPLYEGFLVTFRRRISDIHIPRRQSDPKVTTNLFYYHVDNNKNFPRDQWPRSKSQNIKEYRFKDFLTLESDNPRIDLFLTSSEEFSKQLEEFLDQRKEYINSQPNEWFEEVEFERTQIGGKTKNRRSKKTRSRRRRR